RLIFFFSSRRRHTRFSRAWSSDVCSSDLVRMRIGSRYDRIPVDSFAAIMTSGLLGGQYIGIDPGGAEEYLGAGDQITEVQNALVLENLINQLVATFMRREDTQPEPGSND